MGLAGGGGGQKRWTLSCCLLPWIQPPYSLPDCGCSAPTMSLALSVCSWLPLSPASRLLLCRSQRPRWVGRWHRQSCEKAMLVSVLSTRGRLLGFRGTYLSACLPSFLSFEMFVYFVYLKERASEVIHLPFHCAFACNSQGWAREMPGPRHSAWVSPVESRDPAM